MEGKNFGTKPKLFDVFQLFFSKSKTFLFIPKILEPNQHFLCVPTFLAKAKRYYLIQKLRNRAKIFVFSSQISKNKTKLFVGSRKILKLNNPIAFGLKILRSEREHFGSKTNIFNFFGDVFMKMKASDLEKTLV